ncbi:hypothetical protein ACWENQ_45545, partial [Nonomuraea sp. NPDC004354]
MIKGSCPFLPYWSASHEEIIFTARHSHSHLKAAGVTRVFSEKISTRATTRPELDKAVALARELRSANVAVTHVVHEHKRLGRGLDRALRPHAEVLVRQPGRQLGGRPPGGRPGHREG